MLTPDAIILHDFDQSPFSEKIRVIFGSKQLAWRAVRISRLMPGPNLMALTGGYRRTPTMQIGADIYCDAQIITRELQRAFSHTNIVSRRKCRRPLDARDVDGPDILSEYCQPGVRHTLRQGTAGFHQGS